MRVPCDRVRRPRSSAHAPYALAALRGPARSWGAEKAAQDGFLLMTDDWFSEHVFEIAAHRRYLTSEQLAALDMPPIELPPWDPMGALARSV